MDQVDPLYGTGGRSVAIVLTLFAAAVSLLAFAFGAFIRPMRFWVLVGGAVGFGVGVLTGGEPLKRLRGFLMRAAVAVAALVAFVFVIDPSLGALAAIPATSGLWTMLVVGRCVRSLVDGRR